MGTKTPAHGCLHHRFRGHEVQQKYGDVPIRTLRLIYGGGFAPAFCASYRLRDVLPMLDRPSLDKLLADYKHDELDAKIAAAIERDALSFSASLTGLAIDHSR
jgi:hypothetical protein